MERVSPLGQAQHSGTYNAHLTAIMAGLAFFDVIDEPGCYEDLLARSRRLYGGIDEIMRRLGFLGRVQGLGARFSFLFGPPAARDEVLNYQDVMDMDCPHFIDFAPPVCATASTCTRCGTMASRQPTPARTWIAFWKASKPR